MLHVIPLFWGTLHLVKSLRLKWRVKQMKHFKKSGSARHFHFAVFNFKYQLIPRSKKAFTEHHRPLAFSTRREGTVYVGWGPAKGPPDETGLKECPASCRPEGHQDWTFCWSATWNHRVRKETWQHCGIRGAGYLRAVCYRNQKISEYPSRGPESK